MQIVLLPLFKVKRAGIPKVAIYIDRTLYALNYPRDDPPECQIMWRNQLENNSSHARQTSTFDAKTSGDFVHYMFRYTTGKNSKFNNE